MLRDFGPDVQGPDEFSWRHTTDAAREVAGLNGLDAGDIPAAGGDPAQAAAYQVSVIAWLGYDPPQLDSTVVDAAGSARAQEGATNLESFVNGLRVSHDAGPIAREGGNEVQVMKRRDAEKNLRDVADQTAGILEMPLSDWDVSASPCENAAGELATDGRWVLSGAGGVGTVAPENQIAMLNRLRDRWTGLGYEITVFHLLPDGGTGGSVSAYVPGSGVAVTVQSTVKRTGMAIIVDSPCYLPAPGEDPANRGY